MKISKKSKEYITGKCQRKSQSTDNGEHSNQIYKMKIGILGTRGIPNQYGGFEQLAEYLSAGLQKKSFEVYVYNTHNHSYQEKKWNEVNIIHCFNPEEKLKTAGQFIYDLNCILDARKRNFDVLLILGYTSISVWGRLISQEGCCYNKYGWPRMEKK